MSYNKKNYPKGSVLSQLFLDIYANKDTGEVTILYDTALSQSLKGIEYEKETGNMIFVFEPGKVPLGDTVDNELSEFIEQSETITLIHVDMKTKEPVSGMEVPLKII